MSDRLPAKDIASKLAEHIEALSADILPAGRRIGHEWRCGSVAGEAGHSLGVHLHGAVPACGPLRDRDRGDALDLVAAVCCGGNMAEAIRWAER